MTIHGANINNFVKVHKKCTSRTFLERGGSGGKETGKSVYDINIYIIILSCVRVGVSL